jgi:hypothetical protein
MDPNSGQENGNPAFQASLAQFRRQYSTELHNQVTSYATAIYTNAPAGAPSSSATVALLYMGFNSSGLTTNPAGAIKAAMGVWRGTSPMRPYTRSAACPAT